MQILSVCFGGKQYQLLNDIVNKDKEKFVILQSIWITEIKSRETRAVLLN